MQCVSLLFIFHFVSGDKMSYLFGEKASQSSSEFERVTLKTQMMSVQGRIIKQWEEYNCMYTVWFLFIYGSSVLQTYSFPKKTLGQTSVADVQCTLHLHMRRSSWKMHCAFTMHWLPIAARIKFKTLMLAYRTTTGSAPAYFHSPMTIYIPSRSQFEIR